LVNGNSQEADRKLGHFKIQLRPLRVKTGKYPERQENGLTAREQTENMMGMSSPAHCQPPDPDDLEASADQAIAACGGDARDAVKALIVATEFLESEVCELMQAVSHAYARGRFKTYSG
jgi:hypothetical protein